MRSPAANLRSLLSGLFFIGYGLFALPFAPILLLPVWKAGGVRFVVRLFYRLFVLFARLTHLYRVELDASTRQALADCRGRIVVANHLSLIDICILLAHLPDSTAIAKAETLKNPFLRMVVRRMFLVNDADPLQTIASARSILAAGVNLVVFPQGTRGGMVLKRGAARFALACQAPISAFHLDYDPVPLAKGQPWWDVGARQIMVKLTFRGVLQPGEVANHRRAIELTEQIGELIR